MTIAATVLPQEQAFIGGHWCAAISGEVFPVVNPADGTTLARVPDMATADAVRAIEAAIECQQHWQRMPGRQRGEVLYRWYELILQQADRLTQLITAEQGKPLAEARGEVIYGAGFVRWYAEEAARIYGDVIPSPIEGKRMFALRQPVGVVAAITPWNFPVAMVTRKVAPALAAGCTVILKPAESTPLSALVLAELAAEAGFPGGAFNVLTCSSGERLGNELTRNPMVRKLSFTGSTQTGKKLLAQCAPTVKKVSLELGGNAPFIVFDDADLEKAVRGAVTCKYRNNGQTCICANRFLVQDGIYDQFAALLAEHVGRLRVGPGDDASTQQGPLINEQALAKVERHVADAVAQGAHVLCGGKPHARGGNYYEPTVLTGLSAEMLIAREETFGPVAPLFRFRTEEEVVAMANNTEYGLAAYLYSENAGRCWRVAEALEYGMVGINEALISSEAAPFGGIKESGLGVEGSRYGIDEFVEFKYLCMGD